MARIHKMNVTGYNHYQERLRTLLTEENFYYSLSKAECFSLDYAGDVDPDEKIYKYEIAECRLDIRHEPGNQYDPAALKVFADGVHIGYVPRAEFYTLKRIAAQPDLKMHVEIYGGPYKILEEKEPGADWMCEYDPKDYVLRKDEDPVRAIMVFEW